MPPNNPYPPQNQMPGPYNPSPNPQNPYDFITNSSQQPGKNIGPSSMKGRIIVVVVGIILLMILIAVVGTFLSGAGKAQTEQYVEIAKSQTEIIRISALAEEKTRSTEARTLAVTTRMTFTTAQSDMNKLLGNRGVDQKALSKTLSASQNAKSTQLLNDAEKNGRYDETYLELLKSQVDNYKKLLRAAAGGANPTEKATLDTAYNQAITLIPEPKTSAAD